MYSIRNKGAKRNHEYYYKPDTFLSIKDELILNWLNNQSSDCNWYSLMMSLYLKYILDVI